MTQTSIQNPVGSYAPINGLNLYYEVHGEGGTPLVLLHGGMTTILDFGFVLPTFAASRQVIVYERQGHGHTADTDRPMTLDNNTDDIAALLDHLKIQQADILGYSTGGSIALAFALRHPQRVRKLVLISAIYDSSGYYPGIMEGLTHASAKDMPDILREMYTNVAPHPENWESLVEKSVKAAGEFKGWTTDELKAITAPTLVMLGDIDIVRTEHAVELYRALPNAGLAVLPATDHVAILMQHAAWVAPMVTEFLDAEPAENPTQ